MGVPRWGFAARSRPVRLCRSLFVPTPPAKSPPARRDSVKVIQTTTANAAGEERTAPHVTGRGPDTNVQDVSQRGGPCPVFKGRGTALLNAVRENVSWTHRCRTGQDGLGVALRDVLRGREGGPGPRGSFELLLDIFLTRTTE